MNSTHTSIASFMDFAAATIALPPSQFPPLEKHPYALARMPIMHPFLGELGIEVRGFLGQIEPWLRSGWVIPARRPCFYPPNTVFDDFVFFSRIDEIKKEYGLFELVGRLANFNSIPIANASHRTGDTLHYLLSGNLDDTVIRPLMAQRDLRRAFFERYGHDRLVPTEWHLQLSSQWHAGDDLYYSARHATVPGYTPALFTNPPFDFQPHIGIQLRNIKNNPARNSDPERMRVMATQAAGLLNLPVVVYGRPTDNPLPGCPRTTDLLPPGVPQLNAELVFLKKCRLMIAPDSGWADLMGWLRVPTLLERLQYPYGFESLRPFRPRILLAKDFKDISAEIAALCDGDQDATLLPDRNQGDDPGSDFLHPQGAECREFWKDYARS